MKEKLTIEKAKKISAEYLNKVEDKRLMEFLLIHSSKVAEISILIGKVKKLDIESLEIAGFVHDIGYFISEHDHPKNSLDILVKKKFEIDEKLKDCVLNHGANDEPQTEEGKIFQIADKISILDQETLSIFLNDNPLTKEEKEFLAMMLSKASMFLSRL